MTDASRLEFDIQSSPRETVGLDLSDESGTYVVVDAMRRVTREGKLRLTQAGLQKFFGQKEPTRVAIEVGQHSPWVSRELAGLGHEVIVANARQVRLISQEQEEERQA